MKIRVPKEVHAHEARVALTPKTAKELLAFGFEVAIESGAGSAATFTDESYENIGVTIVTDTKQLWQQADIILKVRAPEKHADLNCHELDLLPPKTTLISFINPAQNESLLKSLASNDNTTLAMDAVPRITRAQKLDALSSMANIAGYRAVIEAAEHFGRFFTGQTTAAGSIPPAKVLVIGAGVAGLSAVSTAGSLGAIVRAFDTRPEVKEQIESMGAKFLQVEIKEEGAGTGGYAKVMSKEFIEAEMALFKDQAKEVDIIITTALIPGKKAPILITKEMVEVMKSGSIIVDLSAEQGGNCELTKADEIVQHNGVSIIGYTDLPSRLPTQASELFATNIKHLLKDLCPEQDGQIKINMDDQVIRGMTVVKDGQVTWPPPQPKPAAKAKTKETAEKPKVKTSAKLSTRAKICSTAIVSALVLIAILAIGQYAPAQFMSHFIVFILACFVGWQVIWSVTSALHTPLISLTNAISSIIVIGALLQTGSATHTVILLAAISILICSINIFGGFYVTQRMLKMFKRK